MRINRFISTIPPLIPAPVNSTPSIITYIQTDFGENAINNHTPYDGGHSEKCQTIFNAVTQNFRNRCTSIQTYNDNRFGNLISASEVLEHCKLVKADIIYTPYVNAAYWENGDYGGFVLSVASHYDNNEQELINRHDITDGSTIFLSESIAVSARRDTPETFIGSTSFGYGMEFFEDCSPEALDINYPMKTIPKAFAELITTDGINITSTAHPTFSQYLTVGEEITIRYSSDPSTWVTTTISEIVGLDHIIVSPSVQLIPNGGIYGWHNVTLGTYISGQAESWAVPLIAGKLKVIKMSTNANWSTIRNAARITAHRNYTGITEIDNTNWDIYRGFGSIQVDAAIEYINSLN